MEADLSFYPPGSEDRPTLAVAHSPDGLNQFHEKGSQLTGAGDKNGWLCGMLNKF